MTPRLFLALTLATATMTRSATAQSLEQRLADIPDGSVQFSFASRPGACGDGETYVRDGFGGNNRIYEGNFSGRVRDDDRRPCVPGPVRVVAMMTGGELVKLRAFIGEERRPNDTRLRDLGTVPVGEATRFLTRLIERSRGRPSSEAILPLVLADSISPWPILLRVARDRQVSSNLRSSASFWLSRGAAARLGVADHEDDEGDDVRSQAVFALSQQPKDVSVPQLIDIARHNRHDTARAQALFWLGQSNDSRAIDLFEEILRAR
jgi:hypothetical protein